MEEELSPPSCIPDGFTASLGERTFLGRGSFGRVFRQYDEQNQRSVASKEIDLGMVTEKEYDERTKKAKREVYAMRKLKHPHIVECFYNEIRQGVYGPDSKLMCIYMEYVPGGSVKDGLKKDGAFSEARTKRYTWQMLNGLLYLHGQRFIHRDLKCSNMLFDERDSVKLADFGLSKESLCSTYESKRTLHTEACGTAHYMAPEVMAGEEYGRKSDIWSAGATVVEMLTTQPPWYKLKDFQVMYKINLKSEPEYVLDSSLSPEVRSFLNVIFNYDSRSRPSTEELLQHDWLNDLELPADEDVMDTALPESFPEGVSNCSACSVGVQKDEDQGPVYLSMSIPSLSSDSCVYEDVNYGYFKPQTYDVLQKQSNGKKFLQRVKQLFTKKKASKPVRKRAVEKATMTEPVDLGSEDYAMPSHYYSTSSSMHDSDGYEIPDLLANQSQYIQGAAEDNVETTSAQTNLGVYQFTNEPDNDDTIYINVPHFTQKAVTSNANTALPPEKVPEVIINSEIAYDVPMTTS